ncbi:MAG: DUF3667 domain-containing protein [Pseudomonadota bacterium]
MSTNQCENCAAPLTGPYCSACGQHAHASVRSLRGLLHDALHDLTHVESHFLATLWILVRRPGQLTGAYFAGKRARYALPFRLYLILSIAFFSLAALVDRVDPEYGKDDHAIVQMEASPQSDDCSDVRVSSPAVERFARRVCRRVVADRGEAVSEAFKSYIPKMMFAFLPLVAAVLGLLYWGARRYYVEHLIFVLHNHAAVFATLIGITLVHLVGIGAAAFGAPALATGVDTLRQALDVLLVIYFPWYVYRSLRTFYGSSRTGTWVRLLPLGLAYLLFLVLTVAATFVLSAVIG